MEDSWWQGAVLPPDSHGEELVVISWVSAVKAMAGEGLCCTSLVPYPPLCGYSKLFSLPPSPEFITDVFSFFFPVPMPAQRLHKLPSAVDLLKHFI